MVVRICRKWRTWPENPQQNPQVADGNTRGGESTLEMWHVGHDKIVFAAAGCLLDGSDTRRCSFHLGPHGDEHERLVQTRVAPHLLQGARSYFK